MKTSILSRINRVAENLYRDPESGRYYGLKKINRKQKLRSLDTTDRPTANRELKKWLRELESGNSQARDRKIEAHLDSLLAIRQTKAPGTFANDQSIAKRFRETFELGMAAAVREIRTSDLAKWIIKQAKDGKGAWRWSATYYNSVRLFLKNFCELAVADGIFDEAANPFKEKIIKAESRKRDKTVRRIPTLQQFEAIINDVRQNGANRIRKESAEFLELEGLAGIGQAEVANFTWGDDKGGKLDIRRQKTVKPFSVPVYPWLAPFMDRLRARRNGAADSATVFTIDEPCRALKGACKRLGFHAFTQRNLRAMCIKRLYDAKIDVKQIAKWQGHSDGGVLIQNIYTEVFCDNDAAAEEANLALLKASMKAKPGAGRRVKIIRLPIAA